MKKLLSILFLFALTATVCSVESSAQVVTMTGSGDTVVNTEVESSAQVVTMTGSGDTVVNTEVEYILYKAQTNYVVSIQLQATKLSGTVAGTAILEGSIDGTNYTTIREADTLTLTNVTSQGYLWTPYMNYRIKITGSGTMAARVYG